ncbi:hypothetical protein EG329_000264 [Mollisiaceae sp. DMI_Dod_QoI]|nr:hypothetical protein EG329_000264 [Helotiales sp. DMI_Dod_QoI]
MDPNRKPKNPFLDPDYLDENERTEEEELQDLALEMTRNGSLTILSSSSRSRNSIMNADLVEAHEITNRDRLDLEAEEIRRDVRLRADGVMRPLDITEVTRVDKSDYSKSLRISHRTELHRSTQLDSDASRKWSCSFCGTDMNEHSWSSPNISPAGTNTPANCSLHLLFSRISQDFFPGARMVLNTTRSHLNNPRFIKLVFDQVDEQSNVMSRTWVDMLYEKPRETERRLSNTAQALKIDMQLQRVKAYSRICAKNHKLCKTDISPIPARRVLDLSSSSTGMIVFVSDDWLAEAEKMAEIYSKSYLTVAASRAQNSHDGFLFDFPDATTHYKITVENPWDLYSQPETYQASFRIDHEASERESTPLNKRAWCAQEWYLPVKMAEFHLHNVKFLCQEGGFSRFGTLKDKGTWSRITLQGSGLNRDKELETLWETIRDDYFGRALTKKSDMLPAIAGLAKRFQSLRKNSTYLVGLWSHNIAEGLSWTALDFNDGKTEASEGVPSWSWASITYAVGYIYDKPVDTYTQLIDYRCTGFVRPKETPASIQLQCFLTPMFMRVDPGIVPRRTSGNSEGHPTITLWTDADLAANASIEQVKAAECPEERVGTAIVLDMNIGPTAHTHSALEASPEEACPVPSIVRVPKSQQICNICAERGYVAQVQIMLLTKSQLVWTALILAPVLAEELKDGGLRNNNGAVYRRLGLLEVDCWRAPPMIRTAEGDVVPAEYFWELDDSNAAEEVMLI